MDTTLHADGHSIQLHRAILIYENTNIYHGGVPWTYATVHDVSGGVIQPGRAITRREIEALSRGLLETETNKVKKEAARLSAVIPETLLMLSPTCMVWYCPSAVRPIFFTAGKEKEKLDGKRVRHPHLLFCRSTDKFSVFALADGKRPTAETPLYQAPYWNMYEDGSMCVGTANIPKLVHPSVIPQAEQAFFRSAFTHANVRGHPLTRHPKGHLGLWLEMRNASKFPAKYLTPAGKTLSSIL